MSRPARCSPNCRPRKPRPLVCRLEQPPDGRFATCRALAAFPIRLRPVEPIVVLETCVETVLGRTRLPGGTGVYLLTRPSAVAEDHFVDPLAFRPERWLGEAGRAHEPSAHIAFGSGPRLCPGRELALLEMKVVLATLYRNFDVQRASPRDGVRERFAFTMHPTGLSVRISARGGVERGSSSTAATGV